MYLCSVHNYCQIFFSAGVCYLSSDRISPEACCANKFISVKCSRDDNFFSNDTALSVVGFQQWSWATVVDMTSPSFACLTSEVIALFVASCFEVCSQQHGQCSFCCPWANLSEIVSHQIIWLGHLAIGLCSALFSLSLSRHNKQQRMGA